MKPLILARSWMFVPGSDPKKMKKARSLTADALIYDLEDAVSFIEKATARQMVKDEIGLNLNQAKYVRINGSSTSFFHDDLHELISENLKGIMLPKSESVEQMTDLNEIISQLEMAAGISKGTIEVVPLIESALGLHRAYEIAISVPRVKCLAFGSLDFALDINAKLTKEGAELLYARSQLVVVSKAAGIESPIDTVFFDIEDTTNLTRETAFAKQLGFQGKLVVHPLQVNIVNEVFSPTKEEIEEAGLLVSAFDEAVKDGLGVVKFRGKMLDRPVVEHARKVLEFAELLNP